jgi:uncharacterized protein YijF (DUF1287 family)
MKSLGLALFVMAASTPALAAGLAPAFDFGRIVASAAQTQALSTVVYDPGYVALAYPNGDVPPDRGVCADVVVRAFRAAGVDLQQLVHEDMRTAFSAYPGRWGLRRPDSNIDHRRVLNLETFFQRHGAALAQDTPPHALLPGDVVSWRLPGGLAHIGVVVAPAGAHGRPMIAHNIGAGVEIEDVADAWPRHGLFRYRPAPGAR